MFIIILKIIILVILGLIEPVIIGLFIPTIMSMGKKYKYKAISVGSVYLQGLIITLALFEILAVPMTLIHQTLTMLTLCWGMCIVAMSLFICVKGKVLLGNLILQVKTNVIQPTIWSVATIIIIGLQIALLLIYEYRNVGDDVYFLATAANAYRTDTLMIYEEYTGALKEGFEAKFICTSFPLFYASISRLVGLHSTITAHVVMSILPTIVSYIIYYMFGKLLFEDKEKIWTMLFFICIISYFASYSFDTPEAWMNISPWLGKAILPRITLPMTWYFSILAMDGNLDEDKPCVNWTYVFLGSIASIMMSSYSAMLMPALLGTTVLYYMIINRKIVYIANYFFAIIPSIISLILYKII